MVHLTLCSAVYHPPPQNKTGHEEVLKIICKTMEPEVTTNYSGTGLDGFLNASNTTTEPTSVEEPFKWTSDEIARLIQIIFRPIFIIVGTIGNGLTIYIMKRTSMKHLPTCFYMFVLAQADSSKYTL